MVYVELSDQFHKNVAKIYIFGAIALAGKFLNISSVKANGTELNLGSSQTLSGIFSLLCLFFLLSTIFLFVQLYLEAIVKDIEQGLAQSDDAQPDFSSPTRTTASKLFEYTLIIRGIVFTLEVGMPILFGVIVTIIGCQDVLWLIMGRNEI